MAPRKEIRDLPLHVIHHHVLHRLTFKNLSRFKCVSKVFNSLITTDEQLAVDQTLFAHASSSNCFVYMSSCGLSFFPEAASVGVPDPSLGFLNLSFPVVILVNSANGLLLLYGIFGGEMSFCVCNPATKEAVFVSNDDREKNHRFETGLVYDPCRSPNRFIIVELLFRYQEDCIQYQFDVFNSEIGKWNRSSQMLNISLSSPDWLGSEPVCVNGVVYWSSRYHVVWYNTEADLAGFITLPAKEGTKRELTHTGVHANNLIYCRSWDEGIEVWRLVGGSRWEILHEASWDSMKDALGFCHGMQLRRKSQYTFVDRWEVQPVGFDGRFVYLTVPPRGTGGDIVKRLYALECKTGRVEDKGLIMLNGIRRPNRIYNYANSMARVPKILSS